MRKVLIVGATSAIAQEAARIFAAAGDRLFLVGRHPDRTRAVAQDLQVRGGGEVGYALADLDECERHPALVEQAMSTLGGLDTVLVAHGLLGDQKAAEQDWAAAEKSLRTNFLSVVSLLTPVANHFEKQGSGTIAVISSVAGDRGRQSNYVYGAAKGGLNAFLSGLRNRLAPKGVQVVTIKPGFVDTPMTAHLQKGPLFVGPEVVAKGIVRAIERRRDVVYLPAFWALIMLIIRHVPERVFKRLKL